MARERRPKHSKKSVRGPDPAWQGIAAWSDLFNRLASEKTYELRTHLSAYRNNPGGAMRSLYQAWSKAAKDPPSIDLSGSKTIRDFLAAALEQLYSGRKKSPVPSLFKKLSGDIPASAADVIRMVSAFIVHWPGPPLDIIRNVLNEKKKIEIAKAFAETFVRELLSDLNPRAKVWNADELETRVFLLVEEIRIGAKQFVRDASEEECALIVGGSSNILIGPNPIETLKMFHDTTMEFAGKNKKGILIFVFDADIFEAGESRFSLLYNIGLLSTAMTTFALLGDNDEQTQTAKVQNVDWSRWRSLGSRCCLVMRRPPLVDTESGEALPLRDFDKFIQTWRPPQDFETLADNNRLPIFDGEHVLPKYFPRNFGGREAISGLDLYWDVIVKYQQGSEKFLVNYFVPPVQKVGETIEVEGKQVIQQHLDVKLKSNRFPRGRPVTSTIGIEEDLFYVIKCDSPGHHYDEAQKVIYQAARGRLKLDRGSRHKSNMLAAAVLRQLGYEVFPASIGLSLFPRTLHFAATQAGT